MKITVTNKIFEYDGLDYCIIDGEELDVVTYVSFDFEYDEHTSIEELIDETCRLSGADARESIDSDKKTGYKILVRDKLLVSFDDSSLLLKNVLSAFDLKDMITSFIEVAYGRGEVLRKEARDKGFRFFIQGREGTKHHKPHMHVEHKNGNSGSVDIITGEQLKNGTLTKKQMRIVKDIMKGHDKELVEYWNYHTDGVNVDVNVVFGITNIVE